MSNIPPKNGRYFTRLDFWKGITPEMRALFDECVEKVLDGTAKTGRPPYEEGYANPDCFVTDGGFFLPASLLEYFLAMLSRNGFDYDKARHFSEILRGLLGWDNIDHTLEQWFGIYIKKLVQSSRNYSFWLPDGPGDYFQDAHAKSEAFRFGCYIAISFLKYGASYNSVNANRIFETLTTLGSNLPAQLKKNGSGALPKEITEYQDDALSCKANDAFATIRITLKAESEAAYEKALDFLCRLLESEFPRSYAIEFKSPEKNFLPIKGLPKKGVHQLFANAARYPALYGKIKRYARRAMKKFEWYNNLEDEACAMPGSFAVFALALADKKYAPLAVDYLHLCDDEHSRIQEKFLAAYVEKFGLGETGFPVFVAGANSMQELSPNKIYAHAVANEESLKRLLAIKGTLDDYLWENVLYALWGKDATCDKGRKTRKAAPPELKGLIESVLA